MSSIYSSDTPATITTKQGLLADVSDGGTITIKGNITIDVRSRGAIECKPGPNKIGGKVNLIDIKEIKCKNGPVVKATDSSVVISSVGNIKVDTGSVIELVGQSSSAKAIISDIGTMSSTQTPIRTSGKSKVIVNNINSINTNSDTFISASSSSATSVIGGGSITVKNIKSIPYSLKIYDHNLTVDNVKSLGSSQNTGIEFNSTASKTAVYKLSVTNTDRIYGSSYSLKVINGSAYFDGIYAIKNGYFYNSEIVSHNCTFGSPTEIIKSHFEGHRLKSGNLTLTESTASFFNSTLNGVVNSTSSSIQTFNSTLNSNTLSDSAFNMHVSKVSGTSALSSSSSLNSYSSKLVGNVTNANSFLGLYGEKGSGSVTTSGKGFTLIGGVSSKSVDGKSMSNGISAVASTLYVLADVLDLTTTGAASMDIGGNYTLTVGGNYSADVTGSVSQTGTTLTLDHSGAISISSDSTVTITGTTVTV